MTLISYRAAAKLAQRSAGTIQQAAKAGTLKVHERGEKKGFDPNEVKIWAFARSDLDQVFDSYSLICGHWGACVIEIKSAKDAGYSTLADYARVRLMNFTANASNLHEPLKFPFSEAFFASKSDSMVKDNSDSKDLTDIDERFLFAIWGFIRDQLMLIDGQTGEFSDLSYEDLGVGTFSAFRDQAERCGIYPLQSCN